MAWLAWYRRRPARQARSASGKLPRKFARADLRSAVLLGMGGSSLCVEVLKLTFGKIAGYPEFLVLDSTDPAQIQGAVEAQARSRENDFHRVEQVRQHA